MYRYIIVSLVISLFLTSIHISLNNCSIHDNIRSNNKYLIDVSSSNLMILKHVLRVNAKVSYVSDLDGDGLNELIIGTEKEYGNDYIYIYQYNGEYYKMIWNYCIPDNGSWGGVTALTTGDLDNDGVEEIIVSTGQPHNTGGDNSIIVFKRTGSLGSWRVIYRYNVNDRTEDLGLVIGDADNDGLNELIVGISWYGRKIIGIKYIDGKYNVFTVEDTGSDVNSIDIGDVDHDGLNEIVVGTSCWKNYDVRVLKYSGSIYRLIWNKYLGWSEARIGDLDGDGLNEILAVNGCLCKGLPGKTPGVRIFKYINNSFYEIWSMDLGVSCRYADELEPFIGDLFGSSVPEFIFRIHNGSSTIFYIYGYNSSSKSFDLLDKIIYDVDSVANIFIGDSDNNDVNELIVTRLPEDRFYIFEASREPVSSQTLQTTRFVNETTITLTTTKTIYNVSTIIINNDHMLDYALLILITTTALSITLIITAKIKNT